MRIGVSLLRSAAALIGFGLAGVAFAQSAGIDPSILSQMSPEERQQLLNGMGGSSGSSSTINQDKTLSDPTVVNAGDEPPNPYAGMSRPSSASSPYGESEDFYGYDPAGGGDVGAYGSDAGSLRGNALTAGNRGNRTAGSFAGQQNRFGSSQRDELSIFPGSRPLLPRPPQPFGYELFRGVPTTFAPATDIPVPADYVIGPGDNVRVQLFGNQNETFTLLVSRDGTINFPKLGPITTTGLRFDELQSMLENRVSKEMIGTTASVTLGRLRSIRVFVLGDVSHPGSYTVSSLSTMTHALFLSGGVSDVGSLRRVQLKRGGSLVQTLDLYRFLLAGDSSSDLRLQPGDVVFVPPVGARVTVEGEVKRPAIYEIGQERSLADVLALAGGRMASSDQTYVEVERISASAERKVLNFDIAKASDLRTAVQDGDVIRVRRVSRQIANEIRVVGFVKYPGTYPWTENRDLRAVLAQAGVKASDAFGEIYMPLGLIQRTNAATGVREFVGFDLGRYASDTGSDSIPLEPNDLVIVFSRKDVAYINSYEVEATLRGSPVSQRNRCIALQELTQLVNSQRATRFLKALSSESITRSADSTRAHTQCPEIFETVPETLPALLDRGVGVYGEVRRPGLYPIAEGADLSIVIQAAAGATGESDSTRIEYLSYVDTIKNGRSHYETLDITQPDAGSKRIVAGDILNLRPIYLDQEVGTIRLMGEVRFPGVYGFVRGETLSHVLERAGGLTENAFPYGAVFTRESARTAEAASLKRAARDLQEAVVTVVSSGALEGDSAAIGQFFDTAIKRLESTLPVGRVVVEADPSVLKIKTEKDLSIEPGDMLMIPKRPTSVAVAGQVLNPGSQSFDSGLTPREYIDRAGGMAQAADTKRAFIVYPDGSAKQLSLSSWSFSKQDVPPGSLIIVPRNAAPLNKLVLSERLLSIFSSLAISTAALVTINNN